MAFDHDAEVLIIAQRLYEKRSEFDPQETDDDWANLDEATQQPYIDIVNNLLADRVITAKLLQIIHNQEDV